MMGFALPLPFHFEVAEGAYSSHLFIAYRATWTYRNGERVEPMLEEGGRGET